MLQNVELILSFFLVFYILILIFDFAIVLLNKISKVLNKRRKERLLNVIKLNNKHLIVGILSDIKYLYILNKLIDEKYKINGISIVDYLNNNKYIINKLSKYYYRKDNLARSYFSYTLSKLKLSKESKKFIFHMLTKRSVYCVENSLKALYNSKDISLVVKAYKILTKNKIKYHNKLITDGMMAFKGDKKELAAALYKSFSSFSTECKIGFINFFRKVKYDISDELVTKLSKNSYNKELEISLIQYFIKVRNKEAYKLFIQRIEEEYYDDVEYEIVMIQALANYKTKKTIELLTSKVSDYHYYVRYNACMALDKMIDVSKLKINDAYAKEMIDFVIDLRR